MGHQIVFGTPDTKKDMVMVILFHQEPEEVVVHKVKKNKKPKLSKEEKGKT